MKGPSLMVFGARKKSIGAAIAKMWVDTYDGPVVTVGVSGEENVQLPDLETTATLGELFAEHQPSRIVTTVGINNPLGEEDFEYWMRDHFHVNAYLPMHILMTWLEQEGPGAPPAGAHYVAISSNSAHIARSKSMAYNMSKAALSMGLKSAARDLNKAGIDLPVYGYEPGLVKGTPMTGDRGGTRMLGAPEGLSRRTLAGLVVHNLAFGGAELGGCLLRIDNGEQ